MTIVFKVSDKLKNKMIKYYEDKKRLKTPPYAIFQADDADTIITLYESGKVMFQGISADIDARMWKEIEKKTTGNDVDITASENKKKKNDDRKISMDNYSTIGSDEVGTGDFFGPIVVTASYVSKDKTDFVKSLGVRDSKALTDEKIMSIAPTLIKEIPHVTFILANEEYNKHNKNGFNMNKIKAILHNKVLYEMKSKNFSYDKIVVDQFVYPKKYFEHIQESTKKVTDITFLTHAEDVCASVAVSSCISRYIFIKKMNEMSDSLHMVIPKGAGEEADKTAARIVANFGEDKLYSVAKLNFKNTEKYKQYL